MEAELWSTTLKSLKYDALKFTISSEEFDQLRLLYRGEGNENLVLQLSDVPFVFRFSKSNVKMNECDENERMVSSFAFYYLFVKSFFTDYFDVPILADMAKSKVRELDEEIYQQRPSFRRNKRLFYNGIEIHPDYAFLPAFKMYIKCDEKFDLLEISTSDNLRSSLSDQFLKYRNFIFTIVNNSEAREILRKLCHSNVETMCVEIKPKQGWTASADRKSLCAYCMNQYLKLSTCKVDKKNEYCPLDLFSGDIGRMKKALEALLRDPQNNLRIFKNGKLIYGKENVQELESVLSRWFQLESLRDNIDNFCSLMSKVLLHEWIRDDHDLLVLPQVEAYLKSQQRLLCPDIDLPLLERTMNNCCKFESNLPTGSLLARILSLQQLDDVGIETVYDYFRTHESQFSSNFGYVQEMIANITTDTSGRLHTTKLNVAQAYLLSALAKDMSVLISMQRLAKYVQSALGQSMQSSDDDFVVSDERDVHYRINMSVVDVAPKPASCIEKHWKRDREVIAAYAEFFCPQAILNG